MPKPQTQKSRVGLVSHPRGAVAEKNAISNRAHARHCADV